MFQTAETRTHKIANTAGKSSFSVLEVLIYSFYDVILGMWFIWQIINLLKPQQHLLERNQAAVWAASSLLLEKPSSSAKQSWPANKTTVRHARGADSVAASLLQILRLLSMSLGSLVSSLKHSVTWFGYWCFSHSFANSQLTRFLTCNQCSKNTRRKNTCSRDSQLPIRAPEIQSPTQGSLDSQLPPSSVSWLP